MKINGFGKIDLKIIEDFEKSRGIVLPDDYKNFLLEYNGGTPEVKYSTFWVGELNENMILDTLYGLNIEKRGLNLEFMNNEFGDEELSDVIIIGSDPGSGLIVLVNYEGMKGVYYWDDQLNFEQSTEDDNMYKVADSFDEFITNLKVPE